MKATERILFKKGRRIICYIDIMPNKIEVKTGKPSDATCISWHYQPNELEKAKYTAKEFFDNCTRIWTHTIRQERTHQHGAPFFAYSPQGKKKQQPTKTKSRGRKQDTQSRQECWRKKENEGQNTPQAFNPPNHSRTQKPHKPRKAPRQYKPTPTTYKPK